MTDEQKEFLIAKMLDAPSALSAEDLEAIEQDEELRDICQMSADLSSACIREPEMNMNEEWARFRQQLNRKRSARRSALRIAAIFAGVLVVASVAVRIMNLESGSDSTPRTAKAEPIQPTHSLSTPTALAGPALMAQQNQPTTSPRHNPKRVRNAKARISPPRVAETSQAMNEIDVDEYLRIQQAIIDNELALQAAEMLTDELTAISLVSDSGSEPNPELDNAIKRVTMQ